jgi:MFS family permease
MPAFPTQRLAVSLLFLMNGFLVGSWAPKIPEFAARLGLSESRLGLMIVAFGIGSLIAMPIVGAVISRQGSRRASRWLALGSAFAIILVTLASNIPLGVLTMLFLGGTIGGCDVAMNANAVSVERRMRRAIMSSCHGFWSLGGLIGAGAGGFLIDRFGVMNHALIVTVICLGLVAWAWPLVVDDAAVSDAPRQKLRLPTSPLPWLVGTMALFAMIPEGSVLDWGALYLRSELDGTVTQSGFVYGAFSATMALMRFAGDGIRDRFGAVKTLRGCALVAFVGMVLSGMAPNATLAIVGFAIAGIGISNLVPIAFSAAGNLPGFAPGIALSVVTFMGYSGILFAPTLLGFVAEHTGFAAIFIALPFLFIVVLGLSSLARHADAGDRA